MATLGYPKWDWWWAAVVRGKGEMTDCAANKVPEIKVWVLPGLRVLVRRWGGHRQRG